VEVRVVKGHGLGQPRVPEEGRNLLCGGRAIPWKAEGLLTSTIFRSILVR
jgi:hypothetical protein